MAPSTLRQEIIQYSTRIDTNITRPPKIPQIVEPSQSKPVKPLNVSAPAPNPYPPDERESVEAES